MNKNSLAQFMKPLIGVFTFLLRKAISLVVSISWAAEYCSRKRPSGEANTFREPEFIRGLLRFCLSEIDREVIVGCIVETYRKIFDNAGKDEADEWLYEEMVESLQWLVPRHEIITHSWSTIRHIFRTHPLTVKLRHIKSKCANSIVVSWEKLNHLRHGVVSTALAILITFIAAPVWLIQRGTLVPIVANGEGAHTSPEETSLNVIPELKTPARQSARVPALHTSPRATVPTHRTVENRKPVETSTVALPAVDPRYRGVRNTPLDEGATQGTEVPNEGANRDAKVPRARIRFSIRLSQNPDRETYSVSVIDGFGKPLVTKQVRSSDGKSLSVVFDLKGVIPNRRYYISVSREGGVPDNYPIVINPK